MDEPATDCGAIFGATVFLRYFNDLPDPRQAVMRVYPLDEVLLLSLLAVRAGAEAFIDIVRFGNKKLALLRRFRPFLDGMPPHDRTGDIFAALDAGHFQRCIIAWVAALTGVPVRVIIIDGKTVRRSGHKKAHDFLALNANQGSLREDVELFAAEQKAKGFADTDIRQNTTIDGDHGRIETRTTTVIHDVEWLQERHDCPGLKAVVMVESSREISEKTSSEHGFISPHWSWWRLASGRSCAAIGRLKTACVGSWI